MWHWKLCSKKMIVGVVASFLHLNYYNTKPQLKHQIQFLHRGRGLEWCLESFIAPVVCEKILWKHVDSAEEKKPEYDSPDNQVISCLIAEGWSHCNMKCSPKGEFLQCDLYGQWVHASCEGIKRDQYRQFSQLAASLQNIILGEQNLADNSWLAVMAWFHLFVSM